MSKTILKSNNIFVEKGNIVDGFVVIDGNRIEAVLPVADLGKYEEDAEIIDYGDQTIMPGFHDGHVHLLMAAIIEKGGDLRQATSEEEAAKMCYEMHKDDADDWILAGAWEPFYWPGAVKPNRKTLDAYFPDKCVLLTDRELHGAWLNSKALETLGIDKNTPDPEGGKVFRDENGEPTGFLDGNAAYDALRSVVDRIDSKNMGQYVQAFVKKAHESGITAVSDVQVGDIMPYDLYEKMDQSGDLDIRLHYSPSIKLDSQELLRLKNSHKGEKLQFSGAKAFMDGTISGYTGMLLEPYSDKPDILGEPASDLEEMRKKIIELDALGIRTRMHVEGDRSARVTLDFFEEGRKINGDMGTRHTMEHLEMVDDADMKRFAELNVIASVQPNHMPRDDYDTHQYHGFIGKRIEKAWPFKTMYDNGARMAFSTDTPCVGIAPMPTVYRAVNRMTDNFTPEGGYHPHEKFDLETVLESCTAVPAYMCGRESEIGALKEGYFADIAVLDQNIFKMKPEDLLTFKIAATWFDGKKVFEAV